MKSTIALSLAFAAAMILAACGSGGPTLGPFPNLAKAEGDAAFDLVAPTSKGPGPFSFSSSNPEVATISGKTVTITGPGTSTITATQEASGSYNSSSTSAVLTVSARACIAPATRQNNTCTAPTVSATGLTQGALTWMAVTFEATWTNASNFCAQTTIGGKKGWRQPTDLELLALHASGAAAGHGWTLARTWSSTASATAGQKKAVRLDTGAASDEPEANTAYVACVI
jgi:hypothetical protein